MANKKSLNEVIDLISILEDKLTTLKIYIALNDEAKKKLIIRL